MNRAEFEEKWIKSFVPHLTKEQYDNCYVWQYLWHVFSYEIITKGSVLTGDAARKAYDAASKDEAITIQLWDDTKDIQTAEMIEKYKGSKELDKRPEFYVVGKDWKWTYVSTHENDWCGPYFYTIE